jgi:hypothetical protein
MFQSLSLRMKGMLKFYCTGNSCELKIYLSCNAEFYQLWNKNSIIF